MYNKYNNRCKTFNGTYFLFATSADFFSIYIKVIYIVYIIIMYYYVLLDLIIMYIVT